MNKALAQQLDDLRHLAPDWDTYGAPVIDPGVIARALELVQVLPDWQWQAVPVGDGGVQLECQFAGYVAEIYIRKWED